MPNRQNSSKHPQPARAAATPSAPRQGQHGDLARFGTVRPRDGLLVLAALVALCYLPALFAGFVWDTVALIPDEPVLHVPSGLFSIWFSPADISNEGHYWPLTYTTFWLEHMLWGSNPAGYHAVNLLLHFVNASLLWRLMRRLAVPGAFAIAVIFAIHPLQVESVTWVIERKGLLSGLFSLGAVLTYLRFQEKPRPRSYGLALLLFACGLLSKSTVVTLPLALLILIWWQTGRVTRKDLLRLIPFWVVAVVITAGDYFYYTSRESVDLGYSFLERCLIAARTLWFYGIKQIWPDQLTVIYPIPEIRATDLLVWLYLVAAVMLVVLLWWSRHRIGRGPLAGALFFAVTLAPVLGFIDYGYMQFSLAADRYQYLAGIGVRAVLVGGVAHLARRLPHSYRTIPLGVFTAVVMILGILTYQQTTIWKTQARLFSHVVAHNSEARSAYTNLSIGLGREGKTEEALEAALIGVKRAPEAATAQAALGHAFMSVDQFDEAERHLRLAIQFNPNDIKNYQNLAEVYRQEKRYDEALAQYQAVLNREPSFAHAYAGMSMTLFEKERYSESLEAATKSLSLQPNLIPEILYFNMGLSEWKAGNTAIARTYFDNALKAGSSLQPIFNFANHHISQKREEEALQLFQLAKELRPDSPPIHHNIAEALRQLGRFEEALSHYQSALDIEENYLPSTTGIGMVLYQQRRYTEAIDTLKRALSSETNELEDKSQLERVAQLKPSDKPIFEHLAAAYFSTQQYEKALEIYRMMVRFNPESAISHSNLGATLFHLNQLEEALLSNERALELDPDLPIAQTGLTAIQDKLGRN